MATATEPEVKRGFTVPCIKCGEPGTVSIDLCDLETCRCSSCDEEFEVGDVREFIARWKGVLAWLDSAHMYAE